MNGNEDLEIVCSTVFYTSCGVRLDIDVYRPNPGKYPGTRPGVLFFFGGGFRTGTPKAFREQARVCATQGYVAFSANYRISSLYDVTPADSMRDGAAAWRFIRENAAEWNADPDRIVLAGGSSGGVIAAMCGPLSGIYPAGLALFNPAVQDSSHLDGLMQQIAEVDGVPVVSTASVQAGMPPMLVQHGEEDQVIPIERIRSYVQHAREQGVDATLITYPGAAHGFFNFNRSRAHFMLTTGQMLLFLERVFGVS